MKHPFIVQWIIPLIFTLLFYGYHAREFGASSMMSIMSLFSCISLIIFFHMFKRVGRV